MLDLIEQNIAIIFPLFFISLWLAVVTTTGLLSGWFRLMKRYPDRAAEPILILRGQSGSMGYGMRMGGVLILSVCPSGLRVGIMRLFGLFCRDFFVPWEAITIIRKTPLIWPVAKLQFGAPEVGSLSIAAAVADRLARAAGARWPELGPIPEEKRGAKLQKVLIEWAIATGFAALLFTVAPLVLAPNATRLPIFVTILFPAIVFGVAAVVRFLRE